MTTALDTCIPSANSRARAVVLGEGAAARMSAHQDLPLGAHMITPAQGKTPWHFTACGGRV